MLYFEQLLVAKVICDDINHMNKYLMPYVDYDVVVLQPSGRIWGWTETGGTTFDTIY